MDQWEWEEYVYRHPRVITPKEEEEEQRAYLQELEEINLKEKYPEQYNAMMLGLELGTMEANECYRRAARKTQTEPVEVLRKYHWYARTPGPNV